MGLQEVTRNHPYYNCDDQPAKIAEDLETATRHDWQVAYEQEWFTQNDECQQSGRDDKETEGLSDAAGANRRTLEWMQKFDGPQILMGDFNAKPDYTVLRPVLAMFRDAWPVAAQAGRASGDERTHGANRIDYMFFRSEGLEVTSVETVNTAGWFTKEASDHKPLVATFRVKPSS